MTKNAENNDALCKLLGLMLQCHLALAPSFPLSHDSHPGEEGSEVEWRFTELLFLGFVTCL